MIQFHQEFSARAPVTSVTHYRVTVPRGTAPTSYTEGLFSDYPNYIRVTSSDIPMFETTTRTWEYYVVSTVTSTTFPGSGPGERRYFDMADITLVTYTASSYKKSTSSGVYGYQVWEQSRVPTTSQSGTSTYFTYLSTTRSMVVQRDNDYRSESTWYYGTTGPAYGWLTGPGIHGQLAPINQIGPVTKRKGYVYLNDDEIGLLYTKSGLNFCDEVISFVSSSTYDVISSVEFLPLIVKASSDGPFTQSTTLPAQFYTWYDVYALWDYGIGNEKTSYFTYYQDPQRWPNGSSYTAEYVYLEPLSYTGSWSPQGDTGNFTYNATTYSEITFSLPDSRSRVAYMTKVSSIGYATPDIIASYDIGYAYNVQGVATLTINPAYVYTAQGEKTSPVEPATQRAYNYQSYIDSDGYYDQRWSYDYFSLFGIEPAHLGLVSPDGGFATRDASESFSGQIPGVTLAYPHATARYAVLVPMPYRNWTTTVTESISSSTTNVQMSWGGGAFHYTTSAGTSTGSGSIGYAPNGSIETTLVTVPYFYETSQTITAYMPEPGLLMVSQGTGSSKTSFTCATTSTYNFSDGGAVMEFIPAIYGPALSVIPKYVYTEEIYNQ